MYVYAYMLIINVYFDFEYNDRKSQAIIGIHCNATMYLVPQNISQTFTKPYIIIILVEC